MQLKTILNRVQKFKSFVYKQARLIERGESPELEIEIAERANGRPICDRQCQRPELLPGSPLRKALKYAMSRQGSLEVFLSDPDVPIDTNHLERGLRPIPLGKKNWMFSWTEIGAERIGVIQSLLVTCRLQGVDPYTYLVDVLQRISVHPASRAIELTPRVWKTRFADNPMKSDLALAEK
jgi:transposase